MSDELFTADDNGEQVAILGEHRAERERNKTIKQQETIEKAGAQSVVRNIMGTATGRRWMADLLEYCEMDSYTRDPPNITEMLRREGRRAVGVRLLTEVVDACPERYSEMRKELHNVR